MNYQKPWRSAEKHWWFVHHHLMALDLASVPQTHPPLHFTHQWNMDSALVKDGGMRYYGSRLFVGAWKSR